MIRRSSLKSLCIPFEEGKAALIYSALPPYPLCRSFFPLSRHRLKSPPLPRHRHDVFILLFLLRQARRRSVGDKSFSVRPSVRPSFLPFPGWRSSANKFTIEEPTLKCTSNSLHYTHIISEFRQFLSLIFSQKTRVSGYPIYFRRLETSRNNFIISLVFLAQQFN